MSASMLQGGRRRRRVGGGVAAAGVVALAVLLGAGVLLLGTGSGASRGGLRAGSAATAATPVNGPASTTAPHTSYASALAPAAQHVDPHFRRPPRAGLMWNLDTGRVLWRIRPGQRVRIASLTKMMTALIAVRALRPGTPVPITRAAVNRPGSKVGMLPAGRRVRAETLLYGLMLPSGNDAAIALAQKVAGSVSRFVGRMNARARAMGLGCTRFTTPDGLADRGNYSCARDLALLARAVLRNRRLAKIVATRRTVQPLPVKGGHVWLYNNNPLMRYGYPGALGVKTGYTDAAGRCLVAAARRGRVRLGVVLLHSIDPPTQAPKLLNAGFRALRR